MFLKLLVLLVPREMQIEHKGGVKAKTDEQLETGIERDPGDARGGQGDRLRSRSLALPAPRTAKRRMRAKNRLLQIVLNTSTRPKSCWLGIEQCQCHVMGASAAMFAKQTGWQGVPPCVHFQAVQACPRRS